MNPLHVLLSLAKGYGLGDCVQVSAVLRHLKKHRPHWTIDYQAEEGRHQVGRGLVSETFAYGAPYPRNHYDAEFQILLFDTWYGWHDRPNTRVASCLHERFGLPWDAACGRYYVEVWPDAVRSARAAMYGIQADRERNPGARFVAVHYQGDSSGPKKDLTHGQADRVCEAIEQLGYIPVILDWRDRSPLHYRRLTSPTDWGKNAEMVCAVISQCAAFVGIDSGPSKCASATDTPSLVVWTGHHPAPFHDPAPNTTHLVPHGYHSLEPVCGNPGVVGWFEEHYNVRHYERDPVREVAAWLEEKLRAHERPSTATIGWDTGTAQATGHSR